MASNYTVQRSTVIEAPAERIFEEIADFHRWQKWSPWEGLDPEMHRAYSGPPSGEGAVYTWSGNRKAGEGRMEIKKTVGASSIEIALDFLKPFKSSSTTSFTFEPEEDRTRVTWTMVGPYTLVTRIMGIFKSMDKMIGPDFEKGLEQLKAVASED